MEAEPVDNIVAGGQSAHASYFANKYLRKQVLNVEVTNVTRLDRNMV